VSHRYRVKEEKGIYTVYNPDYPDVYGMGNSRKEAIEDYNHVLQLFHEDYRALYDNVVNIVRKHKGLSNKKYEFIEDNYGELS